MKPIEELFEEEPEQAPEKTFELNPLEWLASQAQQRGFTWLLAHADDAVIWGRLTEEKTLILSDKDAFRLITLNECRMFGEGGEILIWRDEPGWRIRVIKEDARIDVIDEDQLMWGSQIDQRNVPAGFTGLVERSQNGMRHSVPLIVTQEDLDNFRLRLKVRHYLAVDNQTGETHIGLSRLVSVHLMAKNARKEEGK